MRTLASAGHLIDTHIRASVMVHAHVVLHNICHWLVQAA